MLLRFTGLRGQRGLTPGKVYDVAEILEHPTHLMVREPGTSAWPAPGEDGFGLECDEVESCGKPIEIVSCGYEYVDFLINSVGFVVTDAPSVEALRAFRNFERGLDDYPLEAESIAQWRARCEIRNFEREASAIYGAWNSKVHMPEVFIGPKPFYPLEPWPFVAVCYSCDHIVRCDATRTEVARILAEFADALEIAAPPAEQLQLSYWAGDGRPRLNCLYAEPH